MPPLDESTAERLLDGAPIDDLPEAFLPLGGLLAAASGPPTREELDGSAAAAAAFVAAHEAATSPVRRRRSFAAAALTVVALAASTGTAVAATQGSLPDPMQQVAHEALGAVGISVPSINDGPDHDGTGEGSVEPVVISTPSGASGDAHATPSGTATPANGTSPEPPTGDGLDPATHQPNGNAFAGEGNAGQGNPQSGDTAGGAPSDTTDAPDPNLPSQSNGQGNGPPQVPPGQAKKTP